jgi:hypothetical protein
MHARNLRSRVIDYNLAILQQAGDLLEWCGAAPERARYADTLGPHLRHVLEHYEEFFEGVERRVLDYDGRRRDRSVETDPGVALARFRAVAESLRRVGAQNEEWSDEIAVMLRGGLDGAEQFVTRSSLARELLFLVSHAVHHYALLKPLLIERGYAVGADFGKAPATIQHEREASR